MLNVYITLLRLFKINSEVARFHCSIFKKVFFFKKGEKMFFFHPLTKTKSDQDLVLVKWRHSLPVLTSA